MPSGYKGWGWGLGKSVAGDKVGELGGQVTQGLRDRISDSGFVSGEWEGKSLEGHRTRYTAPLTMRSGGQFVSEE